MCHIWRINLCLKSAFANLKDAYILKWISLPPRSSNKFHTCHLTAKLHLFITTKSHLFFLLFAHFVVAHFFIFVNSELCLAWWGCSWKHEQWKYLRRHLMQLLLVLVTVFIFQYLKKATYRFLKKIYNSLIHLKLCQLATKFLFYCLQVLIIGFS